MMSLGEQTIRRDNIIRINLLQRENVNTVACSPGQQQENGGLSVVGTVAQRMLWGHPLHDEDSWAGWALSRETFKGGCSSLELM